MAGGSSLRFMTDEGPKFTSRLLYRLLHVDALRMSPYHPQTDGLIECFSGTLKEMLRKLAQEDGRNWDSSMSSELSLMRGSPKIVTTPTVTGGWNRVFAFVL